MLSLCCRSGFSLVAVGRGCSPAVVHGLLVELASLVTEHRAMVQVAGYQEQTMSMGGDPRQDKTRWKDNASGLLELRAS